MLRSQIARVYTANYKKQNQAYKSNYQIYYSHDLNAFSCLKNDKPDVQNIISEKQGHEKDKVEGTLSGFSKRRLYIQKLLDASFIFDHCSNVSIFILSGNVYC